MNQARLSVTNALSLRIATQQPDLDGVLVRTPVIPEPAPLPASGHVLPHLLPVLSIRAQ